MPIAAISRRPEGRRARRSRGVEPSDDADDVAGRWTSKIGSQIGGRETTIERVAVREQPLRHALVDDGHALLTGTVVVGKAPAREKRDAEYCEVPRRNVTQPTRRAFFAVRGLIPVGDKLRERRHGHDSVSGTHS